MKKRILIFSTAYYPFVGGAEIAIKEITDRTSKEFQYDLITAKFEPRLPSLEVIGNVTVYRIGWGNPTLDKLVLPFFGAIKAWKLNTKNNYICFWGVMVTFGSGAAYVCNVLRRLVGKPKIPMVLTLQEGDSESHLQYRWGGLIRLSWKLAMWQTDVLTGLSNFLLYRAQRMGYTGTSILVPNGVDLKTFTKRIVLKDKEELRKRFNKKEGDVFLVTTSRLTKKNAVDDIISSLAYLPENISLLVIGKGEEGPHLGELAAKIGVAKRVKFLGFLPYSDIPRNLAICDIFVRPSRSEGFGNSFIEAMAAKLPVIATPVGGIVDFIDDKETGVFCAPDNPKSVAAAVQFLLEEKALKEKIVNQAFNRVVERYSWDHVAREMKKVFVTDIKIYENS